MSLSRQGRKVFNRLAEKPVKWLVKKRVNPSVLTLAGLLMSCVAVVFYYLARQDGVFMLYAGAALAVGSVLDGLDGAVARSLGVAGRRGAFTDSTVDRVEDSLTAVGIMLSGYVDGLLVIVMLASSMLVSYTRARAEALGVSLADVGLAERWLRLAILTVATAAATAIPEVLEAATAVVAVLSTLTVAQRIRYALKALD
ncbi:MAG TPA: CDP-alcohol phosphatidyltransferase family protein [Candidatus Caldiarchaeum subterraneum]|uniref:CDP-alcohol phosphatidyltransferase family protein n=1 Tax=Caldiarchaeum subterraneum TaxID=311458 RepID=A0A832ZW59_CALS0|nr:CDP-alcohol phosphatidyltransferase family protein [Candidatus Caldarchaeum subterraneum]